MKTRLENIPEAFYRVYRPQFHQWAREFRKRGPYAAIPFDWLPGENVIRDESGKPIWRGAWFEAGVERTVFGENFVIKPRTEQDVEAVMRHAHALAPHLLN